MLGSYKINWDTQLHIVEKIHTDLGSQSSTQKSEIGSIFNKKGKLASWVADELPEESREPIGQFLKYFFTKARETVLTSKGDLHPEFKDTIGEDNYKVLVSRYGKEYLHNKVVNSMTIAMSGSITSVAKKNNDYFTFSSLASFLLNYERQYRQIKLDEKLKQQNEIPANTTSSEQFENNNQSGDEQNLTITTKPNEVSDNTASSQHTKSPNQPNDQKFSAKIWQAAKRLLAGGTTIVTTFALPSIGTGLGAGIGALLGTFVLPGVGTGIGAAIAAGFGLATGLAVSGIAQSLKSKSLLAKLLGTGVTASATTAIGAGIGAILGTAFPIPGVGTLAGTLIGAGIGAGAGALATAIPAALGYLGSRVAALVSQEKTNNTSTSNSNLLGKPLTTNLYNNHNLQPASLDKNETKNETKNENENKNLAFNTF